MSNGLMFCFVLFPLLVALLVFAFVAGEGLVDKLSRRWSRQSKKTLESKVAFLEEKIEWISQTQQLVINSVRDLEEIVFEEPEINASLCSNGNYSIVCGQKRSACNGLDICECEDCLAFDEEDTAVFAVPKG